MISTRDTHFFVFGKTSFVIWNRSIKKYDHFLELCLDETKPLLVGCQFPLMLFFSLALSLSLSFVLFHFCMLELRGSKKVSDGVAQ